MRLYSTLLPQAAGQPIWTAAGFTASWASHPREDLSRLPSLLAAGTGQKYHYPWRSHCETARHRLLCGRMGTALHLPWPSLMRFPAQVVLAHPPASLQPSSRRASRQRTYPAAGYLLFKLCRRYKIASSLCRQRGGNFYATFLKIF